MQRCASNLPSSPIRKVLAPVMPFCIYLTLYRVHWKVTRRLELFRSTSVQLLTGSTIREFSSSSALWAMEFIAACSDTVSL